MSDYGTRTAYMKSIAEENLLIAHNKPVSANSTDLRNSFFRINDEAELKSACANWVHFPCMAMLDLKINYRQLVTGIPHKVNTNVLMFLVMLDSSLNSAEADAIDDAYNRAMVPMEQFLSYLLNDHLENGSCGNLFLFDLNRATATKVGPFNANLYGWLLTWYDEEKARGTIYNAANWFGETDIVTENLQSFLTEGGKHIIAE